MFHREGETDETHETLFLVNKLKCNNLQKRVKQNETTYSSVTLSVILCLYFDNQIHTNCLI